MEQKHIVIMIDNRTDQQESVNILGFLEPDKLPKNIEVKSIDYHPKKIRKMLEKGDILVNRIRVCGDCLISRYNLEFTRVRQEAHGSVSYENFYIEKSPSQMIADAMECNSNIVLSKNITLSVQVPKKSTLFVGLRF